MKISLLEKFLIALLIAFFANTALAAKVAKVTGKKILINAEGTSFASGDQLYLYDGTNRKIGLVNVTQADGNKVQADLIGGRAFVGLRAFKKGGTSTAQFSRTRGEQIYMGVIGGFSLNTMNIALNSSTNVSMKGNSLNAKALVDFPLLDDMDFRGYLGIDQLDVTGTANSTLVKCACSVKANYLSFAGIARYFVSFGKMPFWLGAGGGYQLAMSSSSDVLQKVASTNNILFGLGLDFRLNTRQYIPIELAYAYYAPQNGVNLSQIMLKAGYAWLY